MPSQQPTLLLLGGGYVLQKVASLLPSGSFVITSRSAETVTAWRNAGWHAERVETSEQESIDAVLKRYQCLSTVIDSVAPQDFSAPNSYVSEAVNRVSFLSTLKRAIYLSTTGVFGVEDGSWVDETTPCNAIMDRPLARIAFESSYSKQFSNFTTLRIPAIYGPGRGIGHALREQRFPLIEGGARWSNRIHVDNLAAAIILTVNLPEAPPVICVSDAEPAQSIDVVKFYCKEFNLPAPNSISLEEAKARGLHTMVSNQRVSSKLLRESLGFTLKFPSFREGAFSEMGLPTNL